MKVRGLAHIVTRKRDLARNRILAEVESMVSCPPEGDDAGCAVNRTPLFTPATIVGDYRFESRRCQARASIYGMARSIQTRGLGSPSTFQETRGDATGMVHPGASRSRVRRFAQSR